MKPATPTRYPTLDESESRRIKVMLTIDGLGIGGAEMVVRDLAQSLDRARFEVCICCTKGVGGAIGKQLIRENFDLFVLPVRRDGRPDYLTSLKLRRAIKSRRIDIVHSHGAPALFAAGLCKLTMPQLKVVHTFHFGNHPYPTWRMHAMECVCARAPDRLIAVGYEQRRKILEAYKLPGSRISVIWNGIAPPAPGQAAALRAEWGTGHRLLVGTIAKFIEQKGLDDLLSVASRCRDQGKPVQFVIVGDGPLRQQLERRRHELALDETVRMTGWIPDAAARALPAFDVFFQPSRWEAMSIAVLEAMACGRAIVATRVGDNPHMLEHGVSGILVDSGDVNAMVSALVLTSDSALRQRLGDAARLRFEEYFTLHRMVQSYENLYLELASAVSAG